MLGRSQDAMEVAREALVRFPHCLELSDMLRSAWRRERRLGMDAEVRRVLSDPTIEGFEDLIEKLLANGELQEAGEWADRMVSEFPRDRRAALTRGRVYEELFRKDHVAWEGSTAIACFRRAIEMAPGAFEPHLLLARFFAYIGAVSKALHHAFKALDVDAEHEEAGLLMSRLSQLPLEEETEEELLRGIEENDGPPTLMHDTQAEPPRLSADTERGVEQLSSLAGVRRVVLSHHGIEILASEGLVVEMEGENRSFADLTVGFRRVAALSGKRMGIGGLQEVEVAWKGGSILVFAAAATVLLIETDGSPRFQKIADEGRIFLATCTQAETVPVGEGTR